MSGQAQEVRYRVLHRHMHARALSTCDMDHALSDAVADFSVDPQVVRNAVDLKGSIDRR